MSERRFAIITVAVGLAWGAFFYPPPPASRAAPDAGTSKAIGAAALLPGLGYQLAGKAEGRRPQASIRPARQ